MLVGLLSLNDRRVLMKVTHHAYDRMLPSLTKIIINLQFRRALICLLGFLGFMRSYKPCLCISGHLFLVSMDLCDRVSP